MTEIELIRNDALFDLEFEVKDADGNAVNLTGAESGVKFKMVEQGADVLKIDGACTVTNAVAGECKYNVKAGDLDTAGTYHAELEITYTGGKIITTTRFTVRVISDLP